MANEDSRVINKKVESLNLVTRLEMATLESGLKQEVLEQKGNTNSCPKPIKWLADMDPSWLDTPIRPGINTSGRHQLMCVEGFPSYIHPCSTSGSLSNPVKKS